MLSKNYYTYMLLSFCSSQHNKVDKVLCVYTDTLISHKKQNKTELTSIIYLLVLATYLQGYLTSSLWKVGPVAI